MAGIFSDILSGDSNYPVPGAVAGSPAALASGVGNGAGYYRTIGNGLVNASGFPIGSGVNVNGFAANAAAFGMANGVPLGAISAGAAAAGLPGNAVTGSGNGYGPNIAILPGGGINPYGGNSWNNKPETYKVCNPCCSDPLYNPVCNPCNVPCPSVGACGGNAPCGTGGINSPGQYARSLEVANGYSDHGYAAKIGLSGCGTGQCGGGFQGGNCNPVFSPYAGPCGTPCSGDYTGMGPLGPNGIIAPGLSKIGPKDPAPLKMFSDPGLAYDCVARPIIDPFSPRRAVTTWKVNYLISNRNNYAAHIDIALVNPWGIVIYQNQLFIANGTTDTVTNYDLFGNRLLGPISIRDAAHNSSFPTGIAVNCSNGFPVSNGDVTKSAIFMICTEHGTVHAFNPAVDPQETFIVLNEQITGEVAVFKGIAIANGLMYLADFFQRHIDVFDSSYNRVLGYNFVDGDTADPIPLDFAPSNIVHIGCYMYVLWARKDPNVTLQFLDGPGNGFISVFELDGAFVRRFTSRGVLNSPWAMIPAPCECGFPPGSFLVGNNGDGRINCFDCNGRYVGPMLAQSGIPIFIDGLWGLAPYYVEFNEIFFTSTPDEDKTGIAGSIVKDQIIFF